MPGYLVNLSNAWVSGKFIKCLGIWEIYQMPRFLVNSPLSESNIFQAKKEAYLL